MRGDSGCAVDQTALAGFLKRPATSLGGKPPTDLLPFGKVPIAAELTYTVGKATMAYFESGMVLPEDNPKFTFERDNRERQINEVKLKMHF